jgi:shikimate kinase
MTSSPEVLRILLVGFMGSGKSSVGRNLARLLNWGFVDFDREVEKRAGMSIPSLFEQHGERLFRTMEEAVGQEMLRRKHVVLATGGGWPCAPGRMESLPDGTLSVWLKVRQENILARVMRRQGSRPLLDVPDPEARVRGLLEEREPWYAMAHWTLQGDDQKPGALARAIAVRIGRLTDPSQNHRLS